MFRYQFKEKNKEEKSQEMLQKAALHRPSIELPLRPRDKEMTSVRTGALGLKNQGGMEARGEGEEKRKDQGKEEPSAKTPVPESRGRILATTGAVLKEQKKRPRATAAVPAKEKVAQVNASPASFPHPPTKRSQRLKASDFKSEPRWDFEEEYSLDVGGLQTVSWDLLISSTSTPCPHPNQPLPLGSAVSFTLAHPVLAQHCGWTIPPYYDSQSGRRRPVQNKVWTTQQGLGEKGLFALEALKKAWGRSAVCGDRVRPVLACGTRILIL